MEPIDWFNVNFLTNYTLILEVYHAFVVLPKVLMKIVFIKCKESLLIWKSQGKFLVHLWEAHGFDNLLIPSLLSEG